LLGLYRDGVISQEVFSELGTEIDIQLGKEDLSSVVEANEAISKD
jgi:hypothetical protein